MVRTYVALLFGALMVGCGGQVVGGPPALDARAPQSVDGTAAPGPLGSDAGTAIILAPDSGSPQPDPLPPGPDASPPPVQHQDATPTPVSEAGAPVIYPACAPVNGLPVFSEGQCSEGTVHKNGLPCGTCFQTSPAGGPEFWAPLTSCTFGGMLCVQHCSECQ